MFELRILVVDPSKGLRTYVRQLFENFGFDPDLIKTTDDPAAAIELAGRFKPDFVLTDGFEQGAVNALALYQAISAHSPQCRFALLGHEAGPAQQEIAQRIGAIFLLATPCSAEQLRAALGKALKQLAVDNPRVDSHVGAATAAAARHLAALNMAAKSPHFAAGDRVFYQGKQAKVRDVILRRGQLVVRLEGIVGDVVASEVAKL